MTQKNPDDLFRFARPTDGLGRATARGGAITISCQMLSFVLMMASTMVLARLLTPSDFGLIGMVAAIVGFVALFRDLGLSTVVIQRENLTHTQASALFWVNAIVALLICLLTCAIAPLVAWFYGREQLLWVTLALSAGLLVSGLGVLQQAVLRRRLRFGTVAAVDVLSQASGFVVAIATAAQGWGYWALVLQQLTVPLSGTLCFWLTSGWFPQFPRRTDGLRSMLTVGGNVLGFNTVNYLARNLDNVLIGKVWGEEPLGIYSKAYQLFLLPIQQLNAPLSGVVVPSLSRLANRPAAYREAYLQVARLIAVVTIPGFGILVALSDPLVLLVLGAGWEESAVILKFFALAGLSQPITNTIGWLLISQNRTHHLLRVGLVNSLMIVAAFVLGIGWGPRGVAIAYAICVLFLATPYAYLVAGSEGPIAGRDLYGLLVLPVMAAGVGGVTAWWLLGSLTEPSVLVAVLLPGMGGMLIAQACLICSAPHREALKAGYQLMRGRPSAP